MPLAKPKRTFNPTQAQKDASELIASRSGLLDIALGGGSRSGKTFILVYAVVVRAMKAKSRHAIFRYRFNAIKASIIYDTLPKVLDTCFPGLREQCDMNKSDWFLTFPNGSEIWFGGLDDKERTEKILGQEYATLYFNECSQIPYSSVVMALTRLAQKVEGLVNKAFYDFNPPGKRHWTYRLFVEKVNPETGQKLPNPEEYGFHLMNPEDNRAHLDEKYIQRLEALPERARKRFLLGQFADDDENSLWKADYFSHHRMLGRPGEDIPRFVRVVVAVDPSGCSGDEDTRSDEIGMVVCALGGDGRGYLLEDLSGRYGPNDWGHIAVSAFERHQADRIVAETNYGGAMVEAVVRAASPNISFSKLTASRGKVVRAEPIAALYEQGKISHVGHYPEIENQLMDFTAAGYMGLKSPDRGDALVWGFTELFPGLTNKQTDFEIAEDVW